MQCNGVTLWGPHDDTVPGVHVPVLRSREIAPNGFQKLVDWPRTERVAGWTARPSCRTIASGLVPHDSVCVFYRFEESRPGTRQLQCGAYSPISLPPRSDCLTLVDLRKSVLQLRSAARAEKEAPPRHRFLPAVTALVGFPQAHDSCSSTTQLSRPPRNNKTARPKVEIQGSEFSSVGRAQVSYTIHV